MAMASKLQIRIWQFLWRNTLRLGKNNGPKQRPRLLCSCGGTTETSELDPDVVKVPRRLQRRTVKLYVPHIERLRGGLVVGCGGRHVASVGCHMVNVVEMLIDGVIIQKTRAPVRPRKFCSQHETFDDPLDNEATLGTAGNAF